MDWNAEANALLDKLVALFAASPAHAAVLAAQRPLFVGALVQKLGSGWVPKSGYLTIQAAPVVPTLDLAEITALMREAYGRYRAAAA